MYERPFVAEYVVADVTLATANVMYEVAVRHGSRAKRTLMVCARHFVGQLRFDFKPLRVLTCFLGDDGPLGEAIREILREELGEGPRQVIAGQLPSDNPILQVTAIGSSGGVQHENTHAFLRHMRYASEIGERVHAALNHHSPAEAIAELQAIEQEVLADPQLAAQPHTALISLSLSSREKKAYPQMVSLFAKMPQALQRTPVAIAQRASALNRLAEQKVDAGDIAEAQQLRRETLHRLNDRARQDWSSETYGNAGRIYKGQAEAEGKGE
jgi:hypothetical protein